MKSTDLCSQVVPGGQVFEPEKAVPVASPPSTRIVLHHLISQHVSVTLTWGYPIRCEVKANLSLALMSKTAAMNIGPHLHLPQCFAAGGRRRRLASGGAQEDVLLFPVVVTREELLLLGVEQPDDVPLGRGRDSVTVRGN